MNIRKHINDSSAEAEKALEIYQKLFENRDYDRCKKFMEMYLAFSKHAAELTLLLKNSNESNTA